MYHSSRKPVPRLTGEETTKNGYQERTNRSIVARRMSCHATGAATSVANAKRDQVVDRIRGTRATAAATSVPNAKGSAAKSKHQSC